MSTEPESRLLNLVDVVLCCAWYFGGTIMLMAGYPLWAAIVATVGLLVFWRWHERILERRRERSPIPTARLVDRRRVC